MMGGTDAGGAPPIPHEAVTRLLAVAGALCSGDTAFSSILGMLNHPKQLGIGLEEMRNDPMIQPCGPFSSIGYSTGGLIPFEMAQLLLAQADPCIG
jgi:hypothetical protein